MHCPQHTQLVVRVSASEGSRLKLLRYRVRATGDACDMGLLPDTTSVICQSCAMLFDFHASSSPLSSVRFTDLARKFTRQAVLNCPGPSASWCRAIAHRCVMHASKTGGSDDRQAIDGMVKFADGGTSTSDRPSRSDD